MNSLIGGGGGGKLVQQQQATIDLNKSKNSIDSINTRYR